MVARPRSPGFTIIEMMVAVTIVAILAALAATAMIYGTGRARVNNTAFDVAAFFATSQLRAVSTGTPHFVIFHDSQNEVRVYLVERPVTLPDIDWASVTIDPGQAGLGGVNGFERDRLSLEAGYGPDSGGVSFMSLDSTALKPRPLPAPFQAIPLQPSGGSRLMAGCSFCINGNNGTLGVIRFDPDGTVSFPTNGTLPGGAIAFTTTTEDQAKAFPRLLVISAPAGAVRVF